MAEAEAEAEVIIEAVGEEVEMAVVVKDCFFLTNEFFAKCIFAN